MKSRDRSTRLGKALFVKEQRLVKGLSKVQRLELRWCVTGIGKEGVRVAMIRCEQSLGVLRSGRSRCLAQQVLHPNESVRRQHIEVIDAFLERPRRGPRGGLGALRCP